MRSLGESFRVLNEFKGFGEPQSKVWFVGIEEGHEWTLPELTSARVDPYAAPLFELDGYYDQEGRRHSTKVYSIAARLALSLLSDTPGLVHDPDDFQRRRLGRRKSETFLTNLYPLGKRSRDAWPAHYQDLGFASARDCRMAVGEGRFRLLRELRDRHGPQIVVCHGEKEWDAFAKAFADPSRQWTWETLPNGKLTKWQPGLVLTQFFTTMGGLMTYHREVPAVGEICRRARQTN
jgi:hypothetical protein